MPTDKCPKCSLIVNENICCIKCHKRYHYICTNLTEIELKAHIRNKYKPWKCIACIEKYCNTCNKTFPASNFDSICCDKCSHWNHKSCTNLTTTEFNSYTQNEENNKIWKCQPCIKKFCKKCDITLYRKDNILCNGCNFNYHLKCSGLTKDRFKNIKDNKDTWYCKDCYSSIFPFHQIDNNKLGNLRDNTNKKHALNAISTEGYDIFCKICDKKVIQPKNSLPCSTCNKMIHKKCSKLHKNDIKNFHIFKGNWECISCINEKYPFAHIDNSELNQNAFNSNTCPCKYRIPRIMIDNKLKLMLTQSNQKESWNAYNFEIDNEFEENVEIKPNFKYYDIHDFHKLKDTLNKQANISIFHTNICSLNANGEHMETLLHDLDFKFDIMCVTETWNPEKTNDNFSPLNMEGYHKYHGTTGSSAKGGCGVYVKETLNFTPRNDLNFKLSENGFEYESCWIELINSKTKNTLIGVIYRHPSAQDSTFNGNLKKVLKKIKKENKKTIICGDFNYNLLDYDKDEHISNFLNTMLEHNFQPCITEPTRITNSNKPSLVDNIFINSLENPMSGNILEHISYDHLPNFAILEHERNDNNIKIKVRNSKNFDQNKFLDDLQSQTLLHEIENAYNANMAFDIYHKKFIHTLNKHAPIKYLNKREIRTKQKPWLTTGILNSIKKKRTLFKKFKTAKIKEEYSDDIYNKYKVHRDMINTLKRKSKRNYYKEYFTTHVRNSRKTWKGINQLLNKNSSKQKSIFLGNTDGLTTDQRKVANKFNQYFINVAENLSKKIEKRNSRFQDYLKNPNKSNLYLKETTPDEINLIINDLNANKSSDIYDISPKYVKFAGPAISVLLAIIFNKSIREGTFPEKMKTAKVIPLHKGESVLLVSNYRPISLLPVFSKIFERLIFNRLTEFINRHKILTPNQFGFQKNKSTELAVASIISQITNTFENNESAYCIFLDFAKAFDTVNHDILLEKLKYYGVTGTALLWFKSYLSNRTQYTEVGDTLSEIGYIKCGVPQGSVLGPLLFLLYINDITESSNILKFFLFADDTTVFYSDKSNPETESILNAELNKISEWLAANKLSLNVKKSNLMHFYLCKNKKLKPINLLINDIPVNEKTVTKYLGTLIDNKLNWKQHIQFIKTKLSRATGIISKIRYYVPRNVLKSLYYSFIQSYVNYGLLNWSSTHTSNLECIRLSIKKAIRTITFENKYEHTTPLFKDLEILPLDHQIKHKQAVFMWKLHNGYIPPPISDLFKLNTSDIMMRTHPNSYCLPNPRLDYAKRHISFSCVKLWNTEIPRDIKQIKFQKTFAQKYKSYLLGSL